MTITTSSHPKALWPGVFDFYGRSYEQHGDQSAKLFDKKSSTKAYEELVELTGFSLASVKSEGQAVTYEDEAQGTVTRATHVAYALGYKVSKEELADGQYEVVSKRRAEALAFSMATTRNTIAANVYNRAFNSSYLFGDGVEILSLLHPTLSGNQANELSVAADLSEASLEDLCILIGNTKNSKGLRIAPKPQSLIVSVSESFNANRILTSTLQNDTANNAVNVLKSMGSIPGGIVVNNYLTSAKAFFVRTNVPSGMICFDRAPVEFEQDNDFDTKNAKASSYMRFSLTVGDWRALYGSPGT